MKILIASSICNNAIDQLQANHEVVCAVNQTQDVLCEAVRGCDAIVFRSGVQINRSVMSCAPELKLLIRAGSGLDNLDMTYVQEKGIRLVRIPEPGAQAVAELAFGHMLTLARQIRISDQQLRQGHWTKTQTTGYVLRGKVLGIVGTGNIGRRVGQMGVAWGMQAIGCVESPSADDTATLAADQIRLTGFDEVITNADFLTIHVPLQDSTRCLINADALSKMKPGAFLINMARGGVVDESALYDALVSESIAGAALDVHVAEGEGHVSPLASLPNVVLTPHIGATTVDTMREIGERVVATLNSAGSLDCVGSNQIENTDPESLSQLRRA